MSEPRDIDRLFADGGAIDAALQRAAASARREYVRLGHSMPTWQHGRLVWVRPEQLDHDMLEVDPELPSHV